MMARKEIILTTELLPASNSMCIHFYQDYMQLGRLYFTLLETHMLACDQNYAFQI